MVKPICRINFLYTMLVGGGMFVFFYYNINGNFVEVVLFFYVALHFSTKNEQTKKNLLIGLLGNWMKFIGVSII